MNKFLIILLSSLLSLPALADKDSGSENKEPVYLIVMDDSVIK